MEEGDLFGALIVRKLNPDSTLYNAMSLFGLSLPKLEDVPRDIFNTQINRQLKRGDARLVIASNDNSCIEGCAGDSRPVSVQEHLHPKPARLPIETPCSEMHDVSEELINQASTLAIKGVPSNIFRLECKPPLINVPGRSIMSVRGFLREVRSVFVIRALINRACSDFLNYGVDTASLALGSQLTEVLHLLDVSLTNLHASTVRTDINGISEAGGSERNAIASMVVLWERTQLHRMLIFHLFAVIRPAGLDVDSAEFGNFVQGHYLSIASAAIDQYLQPRSWGTNSTGWTMFHAVVSMFGLARNTAWSVQTIPIFEKSLFLNACDFQLIGDEGEASICLNFSRMVLTGAVARQMSVPLLVEIKTKLYDLDAEFYAQNSVQAQELESGLLISIDALWRSFTDNEQDCNDTEILGCTRDGRRAEQVVEFLLGALAWARGRVQLMLLVPQSGSSGDEAIVSTASDGAGSQRRLRVGSLRVRDRADGNLAAQTSSEVVDAFNRQEVVDAFRAINPQLVLPLNDHDERSMSVVKEKSLALQSDMRVEVQYKMNQWYLSFATLSDYYNENAVSVKSMFAKIDAPVRTHLPVGFRTKSEEDRVSLVRLRLDKQASQRADGEPAIADPNSETFLSGPLNVPRTVPKDLVEAAKDHIRAKYVSLMKEVDARSSAAAWSNKRHDTLSQARGELSNLFEQDAIELERLRALKRRDTSSYQRHFDEQLGVSHLSPLPLQNASLQNAQLFSAGSITVFSESSIPDAAVSAHAHTTQLQAVVADTTHIADCIVPEESTVGISMGVPSSLAEEPDADAVCVNKPVYEDERVVPESGGKTTHADIDVDENPHVVPESPFPPPRAVQSASHSLLDIAPSLLGDGMDVVHPAGVDADSDVLGAIQSLAQTILLLASAHGLVTYSAEDLTKELDDLVRENPETSLTQLQHVLMQKMARPVSNLHSLHSILMRSLGRAVLAQCRAINLASLHCLINSSVDLLGHIQAVDSLLLVSPNSDFLVSLCTLMVDQHHQSIRTLHRQRGATVASLSPQLRNAPSANLWNEEALQVGVSSVLASASTSSLWREYGALHASFHTAEEPKCPAESVGAVTMRWSAGLFSATLLSSLVVQYDAPWPVPAIISAKVLGKFSSITRRFLEVGQLVALFRVVWSELRTKRVVTSRNKPAGSAHPAQVDRQISDSMRLVQQTVQHFFDYLSERVYVHQARFKLAMHRAASYGLDAIVNALHSYSDGLSDAALQFTAEERGWLLHHAGEEALPEPGSLAPIDPSLGLKSDLSCLLECCRRVLSLSKALSEVSGVSDVGRAAGTGAMDSIVQTLKNTSDQIKLYKGSLVKAAKNIATNGKTNLDLQPLVMRFESSLS